MAKNLFKHYIYPTAILAGSIIGVGFLSLPYITLRVGIWPMLFYFVLLTILVTYLNVIFGKISLKTPDFKRFPGFVGYYLGKWPKIITLVSVILGSFGLLLVYLIVGGQFLAAILQPMFGGSALVYILIYFLAGSLLIYFSAKTISHFEFFAMIILLGALAIVFIKGFWQIKLGNMFLPAPGFFSNWQTFFLPYGAIIFSLWGIGLIPETEEMLIGKKKLLKNIIIISTLIAAAIYLFFIFLILGITGAHTTESALVGLKGFLGQSVFSIAILIGLVTTFTSFVIQGLLMKKTFMYDMGMKAFPAWVFTCCTPLVLFLLGFNSFIVLISLMGGLLGGLDGILILLMYKKIGGKKVIVYPLTLVFILGMIYSLVYFVK